MGDPDGVEARSLAGRPGIAGSPTWSPDGCRIVFVDRSLGQADLFEVAASGGPARRLFMSPHGELSPAFSRNGRWLYYSTDQGGRREIRRTPAEKPFSSTQTVVGDGAIFGSESFDGRRFFFARHRRPGIWVKDLPNGDERLFVPGLDPAAWSEWALSRDMLFYLEHGATSSALHAVPLDAPQEAAVHHLKVLLYPGGMSVSPDGRTLYLVRLDRAESDIQMVDWPHPSEAGRLALVRDRPSRGRPSLRAESTGPEGASPPR